MKNQFLKDIDKWGFVLNQADIGDRISINGVWVIVEEDKDGGYCNECAFNDKKDACLLANANCVTPCSIFNNKLGKSLIFKWLSPINNFITENK
jgi:hypothetical protein